MLFHLGGAVAEVDHDATAYPHRGVEHTLNINAVWLPDAPDGPDEVAWVREFSTPVRPFGTGVYVNFLDHDDLDRASAAYGDHYPRLVAGKDRYGPDDVFGGNHAICPARGGTPPVVGSAPVGIGEGSASHR